jgi:hypothetical protein
MASAGWLIYHPERQVTRFENLTVYHDSFIGNQDPYIWSYRFLHTACHMTQMSPEVGHTNFWVSGDAFPSFSQLWCDLVFVVQDKVYWTERNRIAPDDPMVESPTAYADHYAPMPNEHPYGRRRRFTLKADPERSFQPQKHDHTLIDAVPLLENAGFSLDELRKGLRAGFQSKPLRFPASAAHSLNKALLALADIRLRGADLEEVRLKMQ